MPPAPNPPLSSLHSGYSQPLLLKHCENHGFLKVRAAPTRNAHVHVASDTDHLRKPKNHAKTTQSHETSKQSTPKSKRIKILESCKRSSQSQSLGFFCFLVFSSFLVSVWMLVWTVHEYGSQQTRFPFCSLWLTVIDFHFARARSSSVDLTLVESFRRKLGERDVALSFEEACLQVNGMNLIGPQTKPLKSDRPTGDVCFANLPLRDLPRGVAVLGPLHAPAAQLVPVVGRGPKSLRTDCPCH